MDERRLVTLVTVAGSTVGALLVILFAPIDALSKMIVMFCIIIAGQVTRYIIINIINKQGQNTRLTRKELETDVRGFFDGHPEIAARFLRMDELARKGRYGDALSLANSLKKEPSLSPVVKRYLKYKIDQFQRTKGFGLK